MSGTVTEFASVQTDDAQTITAELDAADGVYVTGSIYEQISAPYTDPSTGETTETTEIIPIAGLVTITDTTASGLVIPLGTVSTSVNNDGLGPLGGFYVGVELPALGANMLTATVTSPGGVPASTLPAGDTDTITDTLLASPIVVNQPVYDVVTDTVNEPAPQADLTVSPFSLVTLTDPNPLQLDSAAINVSGPIPYTLSLPDLQDLTDAALAAALDQITLTFTALTSGIDTVTATITDIAGLSTTLVSQASLVITTSLPPQPISVSDAAAAVTDSYDVDAGPGANSLQLSPFQDVSLNDPNSGRVDSATITVSGPIAATLATPSLQNLPAAALAAALDADTLTFTGGGSGTDTVTAVITDSLGETTTLTSTDGLAFTEANGMTATSANVVIVTGNDTGTADEEVLNSAGVVALTLPLSNDTVGIYDGSTELDEVSTTASGDFTGSVLPAAGASLTASVVSALGAGPDTLVLFISQRGAPGGADFTISVDGTQIGGVQNTTATGALPGQAQEFDVQGTFAAGLNHTVSIDYLNADESLLIVNSGSIDGVEIPTANTVLSNDGTAGFSFNYAPSSIQTIGSGADNLLLNVSVSGNGPAKFTVAVNGEQIGGVQTTDNPYPPQGPQTPNLDIEGNFPNGNDTLTFTFLNANNSILIVTGSVLDTTPSGSIVLSNDGSESVSFDDQLLVPAIGSGPDALELTTSQAGEPAGAEFTVSVDGAQIGGVQTTTADNGSGQSQPLLVLGDFAPGASHDVSINYLNADNSLLFVDNATINGDTIAGGSEVLSNNGSLSFSFTTPPGPATPTTIGGTGPDTLAVSVSEDYFQANAQFTLSVDGAQVGGTQTVTAINGNGQSQLFDVLGNFSGAHTVSLAFQNPAQEGAGTAGLARNLYVVGASIDGTAVANPGQSFTFTH